MKVLRRFLSAATVAAAAVCALTSCTADIEDMYTPNAAIEAKKAEFKDNFLKAYGEDAIALGKEYGWDFSTASKARKTRAGGSGEAERVKRYMFEDLGTVDDMDFNDVVVDMVVNASDTTAEIVHRGGELPFELHIGESVIDTVPPALSSDDTIRIEGIKGWKPSENNVSMTVGGKNGSKLYTVDFDDESEAPLIIACDCDVMWSAERVKFKWPELVGQTWKYSATKDLASKFERMGELLKHEYDPDTKEGFAIYKEPVNKVKDNLFCENSDLRSIIIPDGVTKIGDDAFNECSNLVSVKLPDGVKELGNGSFWKCEGLTSFEIPSSVEQIGFDAFAFCTNLTEVTFYGTVGNIVSTAFSFGSKNLTVYYYGDNPEDSGAFPNGVTFVKKP